MENNKKHYQIKLTGIVQGVGFRPFVFNLAESLFLKGFVKNTSEGVLIEIEGLCSNAEVFVEQMKTNPPPLAMIRNIEIKELPLENFHDLSIRESHVAQNRVVHIAPDICTCENCEQELMNPDDRRYLYPFINCSHCGPRFTIITDYPYDRKNTTMNIFKMCDKCREEYESPQNRRYHAQPVACSDCGPSLSLIDASGKNIITNDIITFVQEAIENGKIIAIKGLGGYHLCCDAYNSHVVKDLRERKRETKSLLQ